MKKLYTIILVVLSLFAFTSCNDFLDMKPTNSVDSEGSISTARDAEVAINGLVREMLSTSLYGRNILLYADAKGGDYTVVSNGRGSDGTLYIQSYLRFRNIFRFLERRLYLHCTNKQCFREY